MSVLQVFLFGKFRAQYGEMVLNSIESQKTQELFCYLLLFRDRFHPRETLADLLWGETSTVQSKNYLRKTLWQLQAALDAPLEPGNNRALLVESDWIQVNSEADLWFDVAEFEQAFALVQGIPGRELDYQSAQTVRKAVDLYRGDLLEGWYSDWCLYERERLRHLYLAMVDKLMNYYEACQEFETGISYGMCALRHERACERTHRRLMRLQYLAGYRTAALRQYERCVQALEEELGVGPAERTVALYEQLRADRLDGVSIALTGTRPTVTATTGPMIEILDHLKHLQASLIDLHTQVQQNIEALASIINHRR